MIDDPVATKAYAAIADALRLHTADGAVRLTFQQTVAEAAAAVDPLVEQLHADVLAALAERDEAVAECSAVVHAERESAIQRVEAAERAVAERVEDLVGQVAWWRAEAEKNASKFAALEDVGVQAAARWGHEGGPSPLRDALTAAGLIP